MLALRRYLAAALLVLGFDGSAGAIEPVGSASRGTTGAESSRRGAEPAAPAAEPVVAAPASAAAKVQSAAKAQGTAKTRLAMKASTAVQVPSVVPSQETAPVPFPAGGYPWQTNVEEACRLAEQHNLPVLALVTSASCPYCKMMREQTLRSMPVAREIGANFIPLRIERGSNPALERQLAIKSYPTMVVLRSDKAEVGRMAGFIQPPQFIGNLKRIESQWPMMNASRPRMMR
jgi:thioredoxin-related protein